VAMRELTARSVLGVSLWQSTKGTRSEPRESGFRFGMLSSTQEEYLSCFVGKRRCRRCPDGRRPLRRHMQRPETGGLKLIVG
jgi:hypothetical protein